MANVKRDNFIGIKIQYKYKKELEKLAKLDNRTLSDYIRLLLINHINLKNEEKHQNN